MVQPSPRSFRLALATSVFLLLNFVPQTLRAHKEYVHQYLAVEAYKLLLLRYPGLASSGLATHIGSQGGGCDGFQFTAGTVTAGAYREDCEDPVFHYGDVAGPLDNAYFSASHFWNADAGDLSTIEICDVGCGHYQNAYQKTLRYLLPGVHGRWTAKLAWPAGLSHFYLQAGGTGSIFHYGMIGFEYDSLVQFYRDGRCTISGYLDGNGEWVTAAARPDILPLRIVAPNNVRDRIAWEVIGRITHLLGDMGVPAHAHNDIHPPFWWNNEPADIFEEEMGRAYTGWDHTDAAEQGDYLDALEAAGAGVERAAHYLLYTTNQVADRFPSNDVNGDGLYETQWGGVDYSVLNIIDEIGTDPSARNVFHREAGDYAFVFSIRAIAGLFHWFASGTGILGTMTVGADFDGATILLDDKPRSAPFEFTLAAGATFTLDAADQVTVDQATKAQTTMRFKSWTRTLPSGDETRFTSRRIAGTAVDGARYRAWFDREVTLTLDAPVHLDGGAGGRYAVDGTDVGTSWSSVVRQAAVPTLLIGMTPPAGSVFLRWSDGERSNPREFLPPGSVSLHAVCKKHLTTSVDPSGRPSNQRRIARTGGTAAGAAALVMAYESAGNIFFSESVDGVTWSDEELVNDGLGNARDPSVEYFLHPSDGESGAFVIWEEPAGGGSGYRILLRSRGPGGEGWTGIRVIHIDPAARPSRATPVISADLAAWKGPYGILVRELGGTGSHTVPGTDAASEGPALDYYSGAEGKFALSWIQPATGLQWRRGTFPGPAWSPLRSAAPSPPSEPVSGAEIVLNATGSGCVAWTVPEPGGWSVRYRFIDQSDSMQAVSRLSPCPIPGTGPPVAMLEHHRLDPGATRDIGLHAWEQSSGTMLSLLLRSGTRLGPTSTPVAPGHPELTRSAIPGPGGTPVLSTGQPAGFYRQLSTSHVPLTPAAPDAPAPLSPASGSTNIGASPQLSWKCSFDAESYSVQVSRNPSFSLPLVMDQGGIGGRSIVASGLASGSTYYWRVRGQNTIGGGVYSQSSSFTTAPAATAPALSGTTVTFGSAKYPRLSWSTPVGATSFRLYRYLCNEGESCAAAATRPALIYEGTAASYTDANTVVSTKSATGRAYFYVKALVNGFSTPSSNVVSFGTQSSVVWGNPAEHPDAPTTTGLDANYPNPFNPSTTIPYRLAAPGVITLSVYNILGQPVVILSEGYREAGFHRIVWNASGMPAGVYFVTLQATDARSGEMLRERRKLILLK